jgi:hypothetical protein
MPRRACLLVACLLLPACVTHAETFDLRSQYHPGQVFTVREALTLELTVVSGDPPDLVSGMEGQKFSSALESELRCAIVTVTDRIPDLVRTYVVKAESKDTEPGGDPKVAPKPVKSHLVGAAVLVSAPKGGKVTYMRQDRKPLENPAEAEKWCRNFTRDLTLEMDWSAAQVKQEWTMPTETARRFFRLSDKGTAEMTVKFVEATPLYGRKVAHMEFHAKIEDYAGKPADTKPPPTKPADTKPASPKPGDAKAADASAPAKDDFDTKRTFDLKGSAYLDLDKHVPYQFEGGGTITVETTIRDKDNKRLGTMTMEGRATMKTTYELAPTK